MEGLLFGFLALDQDAYSVDRALIQNAGDFTGLESNCAGLRAMIQDFGERCCRFASNVDPAVDANLASRPLEMRISKRGAYGANRDIFAPAEIVRYSMIQAA